MVNRPRAPLSAAIFLLAGGTAAPTEESLLLQLAAPAVQPGGCLLPPCRLFGSGAPRLYVREQLNGVGNRLFFIMSGMALAAGHGMNFGGAVWNTGGNMSHGVDTDALLCRFFGIASRSELFCLDPAGDFRGRKARDARSSLPLMPRIQLMGTGRELQKQARSLKPGTNALLAALPSAPLNFTYYTPELLRRLAAPLQSRPLLFDKGKPSVAIHLRRGDLKRWETDRIIPDEWYYRMIESITRHLPNADVHAWSSTEKGFYKESDFDGFRRRGVKVHLDDDDLLDPWAHLARADVTVLSRSQFSMPPALLNPKCVVYPGGKLGAMGVLDGSGEVRSSWDAELKACLARKAF